MIGLAGFYTLMAATLLCGGQTLLPAATTMAGAAVLNVVAGIWRLAERG